jgi:hypothetical protein
MAQPTWTYEEASARLDELAKDGGRKAHSEEWAKLVACLRCHVNTEESKQSDAEIFRRDRKINKHLREICAEAAGAIAKKGDAAIVLALRDSTLYRGIKQALILGGFGGRIILEEVLHGDDEGLCWLAMMRHEILESDLWAFTIDPRRSSALRTQAASILSERQDKQRVA